ncbi:hypothetical protein GBAR_LOCUS7336 [Geodia barretti]|uniref:Uncharacterized protein n=1 Tax=Geodia barretti TaxID=519541 RepID=A0AA35RJQ6_GEOBA|nr:hypothetical protein GBAR_LOCUS7336 [Geodia barretti]
MRPSIAKRLGSHPE